MVAMWKDNKTKKLVVITTPKFKAWLVSKKKWSYNSDELLWVAILRRVAIILYSWLQNCKMVQKIVFLIFLKGQRQMNIFFMSRHMLKLPLDELIDHPIDIMFPEKKKGKES